LQAVTFLSRNEEGRTLFEEARNEEARIRIQKRKPALAAGFSFCGR
jgi:hypothetical protein